MTSRRTTKLQFLLLFPLVMLTSMSGWLGCEGVPSETPQDGRTVFRPEYDYMQGYDALTDYGTVINAFAPCGTDLNIYFDDVITPARTICWDSVGWYAVNQWSDNCCGADPRFDYKAYLVAIQDAYDRPPDYAQTLGYTIDKGVEGYTWSVIFVQAIMDTFPGDQAAINQATIHEMGHMRAALTELCYTLDSVNWYMSPNHDDSSCVMGDVKIAKCTGKDCSIDPHFCPACCNRLSQVRW
jgi:hypothetical protein